MFDKNKQVCDKKDHLDLFYRTPVIKSMEIILKHDLLTTILGTKAKVAVLRVLVFSPALAARQIQTQTGKSWGAVKQAVDSLLESGAITKIKGQWSDEVTLNSQHCLHSNIIDIFQAEKKAVSKIAARIFTSAEESGMKPLSCYYLSEDNEENKLFLVCKFPKNEINTLPPQVFINLLGSQDQLSLEIVAPQLFTKIWHDLPVSHELVLLQGEAFPYQGVKRALHFFEIEDTVNQRSIPGE